MSLKWTKQIYIFFVLFNTANILSLAILPDHRAVKLQALSADNPQMVNGKRIFSDNCSAYRFPRSDHTV